jgi:hypothetical protein
VAADTERMSEPVMSRRIVLVVAGAVCVSCVIALAGCGGAGVVAKDSACLRSHGWRVEQVSKGFFVATRGQEELSYGSSGIPDYGGTPGAAGLPWKGGQLRFACFPAYTVGRIEGGHSSTVSVSSSPSR